LALGLLPEEPCCSSGCRWLVVEDEVLVAAYLARVVEQEERQVGVRPRERECDQEPLQRFVGEDERLPW
jgi:hypothetical protein